MSQRRVYIHAAGRTVFVTPVLGTDPYVPAEDFDKVVQALRAFVTRAQGLGPLDLVPMSLLDEEIRNAEHVLSEVES